MPIETWRRYAPLYIGWRGLLMLGVLTREERARSADQRQQHESEDEQRPKQQQEVIVGQHQRLALRQIGKQLDRGAVGISRDQQIEPARVRFEKMLHRRPRWIDVLDQPVPVEM